MNTNYNILSQIKAKHIYTVPHNYFNALATQIMLKINAKQTTFQIPKNYFNNLSLNIVEKIKLQQQTDVYAELETIAPTLNFIDKVNVYTTPTHYFEQLNYSKSLAKVVNLNITKWYKYVAAAVVIFVIGLVYLATQNKPNPTILAMHQTAVNTNVIGAISKLSDIDLSNIVGVEKTNFKLAETTQNNIPFLGLVQEEVEYITDAEMELYFTNNNIVSDEIENINS